MKISKKLLGIGVASIGALASIGGAFALYQKNANNVEIGISAGTYAGLTGSVTYKLNGASGESNIDPTYLKANGENGGTGLSTTYTQVKYSIPLGAEYTNGNAQNFVVGKVGVTLEDVPSAYYGKLAVWVELGGYVAGSLGEDTYGGHYFMNSDYAITNENQTYSVEKDVAVSANGTQHLDIYLKYDLEGVDMLEKDQASLGYTLSVSWGEASASFNPAYVKGDANQWTADDGFAMLPNINKTTDGWEWIYNNLPGTIGETKCFIHENEQDKWSAENYACDPAKSYNVTWSGVNGAAANYEEIA